MAEILKILSFVIQILRLRKELRKSDDDVVLDIDPEKLTAKLIKLD